MEVIRKIYMLKFNDKTYDALKWACMLGLPALAIFLKSIGKIWNLEIMNPIGDTVVAINALLAGSLGISSAQYYAENEAGAKNAQSESEAEE